VAPVTGGPDGNRYPQAKGAGRSRYHKMRGGLHPARTEISGSELMR